MYRRKYAAAGSSPQKFMTCAAVAISTGCQDRCGNSNVTDFNRAVSEALIRRK